MTFLKWNQFLIFIMGRSQAQKEFDIFMQSFLLDGNEKGRQTFTDWNCHAIFISSDLGRVLAWNKLVDS